MDIPGKLRDDLKRIFGTCDPLDYIEDIRHEQNIYAQQDELIVTLRVPSRFSRYLQCSSLYNPASYSIMSAEELIRKLTDEHINSAIMGQCCASLGVQKASDKKPPKPVTLEEEKPAPMEIHKPERVVYSGPKTIVFWPDGTKTMVSRMEGQEHDEYGAFCAAFLKKMFGSTPKAKKFLNSIKVVQEPKAKKQKIEEQLGWNTPVEVSDDER